MSTVPPVLSAGLTRISAQQRELMIHDDLVRSCGGALWRDAGRPDMRNALLAVSRKENGRHVRMNGAKLAKSLDRNPSNSIARPIKDFRDRVTQLMADERGLACGPEDVIASGRGGYHLPKWVVVRQAGE